MCIVIYTSPTCLKNSNDQAMHVWWLVTAYMVAILHQITICAYWLDYFRDTYGIVFRVMVCPENLLDLVNTSWLMPWDSWHSGRGRPPNSPPALKHPRSGQQISWALGEDRGVQDTRTIFNWCTHNHDNWTKHSNCIIGTSYPQKWETVMI